MPGLYFAPVSIALLEKYGQGNPICARGNWVCFAGCPCQIQSKLKEGLISTFLYDKDNRINIPARAILRLFSFIDALITSLTLWIQPNLRNAGGGS